MGNFHAYLRKKNCCWKFDTYSSSRHFLWFSVPKYTHPFESFESKMSIFPKCDNCHHRKVERGRKCTSCKLTVCSDCEKKLTKICERNDRAPLPGMSSIFLKFTRLEISNKNSKKLTQNQRSRGIRTPGKLSYPKWQIGHRSVKVPGASSSRPIITDRPLSKS